MFIILHEIAADLDVKRTDLYDLVAKRLNISKSRILELNIVKQSVDARRKNSIHFVYSLTVEIEGKVSLDNTGKTFEMQIEDEQELSHGVEKLKGRVVVVGTGPAGLFAGLTLARHGFCPLILERGLDVNGRTQKVKEYWESGRLDLETNVQFGEGGAGTFSDGKLTTRINDKRCSEVLDIFIDAGAPKEIKYKAKAHIGTDNLRDILPNIRNKIIELGGEIRFQSKLTGLVIENGRVNGAYINEKELINVGALVLAIGHSARDTFEMLLENGVTMEQKAFSVGARIEHHQSWLNEIQYGKFAEHPALGAADYQLFEKGKDRTAYTFCMCPGGKVVASASEDRTIVTNGMSEYSRNGDNANSAFVVSVGPKDFESNHPLAGLEFQKKIELAAFEMAGGAAPMQKLKDFVDGRQSKEIGNVKPTYTGDVEFGRLDKLMPAEVYESMRFAINKFDNKLKGFAMPDALLTGPETRTSSPIRMLRDESGQSTGVADIYLAGEGAGYAGGIVSAAVDGIRIAEKVISRFAI